MRKLHRNSVITVKARKRCQSMIISDLGRNYVILPDAYTKSITYAEWRFWILKPKGYRYIVIKAIPMHNKESPN